MFTLNSYFLHHNHCLQGIVYTCNAKITLKKYEIFSHSFFKILENKSDIQINSLESGVFVNIPFGLIFNR